MCAIPHLIFFRIFSTIFGFSTRGKPNQPHPIIGDEQRSVGGESEFEWRAVVGDDYEPSRGGWCGGGESRCLERVGETE